MSPPSSLPSPTSFARIPVSDLLLVLIVNVGILRLAGALLGSLAAGALRSPDDSGAGTALTVTLSLILFQALVMVASLWVLILQKHDLTWADLGLRPCPRVWYSRAIWLALVLLPVVAAINATIPKVSDQPFENPQILALAPAGFSWFAMIAMIAMGGIVAPFAEELAFRGLLYPWLRERLGFAAAAPLSAICFAALHGLLMLIPALFAVGLALAWIAERGGSIWPAVVTHAVFNIAMILALYAALAGGAV